MMIHGNGRLKDLSTHLSDPNDVDTKGMPKPTVATLNFALGPDEVEHIPKIGSQFEWRPRWRGKANLSGKVVDVQIAVTITVAELKVGAE